MVPQAAVALSYNALGGKDAELIQWCQESFYPQLRRLPGCVGIRNYEVLLVEPGQGGHLLWMEVDDANRVSQLLTSPEFVHAMEAFETRASDVVMRTYQRSSG